MAEENVYASFKICGATCCVNCHLKHYSSMYEVIRNFMDAQLTLEPAATYFQAVTQEQENEADIVQLLDTERNVSFIAVYPGNWETGVDIY